MTDSADRFSQAQLPQIRAYCAGFCLPELVDEAVSAALYDFRARVELARPGDAPGVLLAKAVRSAAAARARVSDGHAVSPSPECMAMPELLAARVNHELPGDDRIIRQHLSECIICETTFARLRRVEQMLSWSADAVDEEPEPPTLEVPVAFEVPVEVEVPEPEPEPVAFEAPVEVEVPEPEPEPVTEGPVTEEPDPEPEPEPVAVEPIAEEPVAEEPEPEPEPSPASPVAPPPPPPAVVIKRRNGGLVAAMRKVARNAMR